MTTTKKLVIGLVALVACLVLVWIVGPFTVIDPGQQGVVIRLGNVNRVLSSGIHWKFPWPFESVSKLDVQINKEQVNADSASKDLQTVHTVIAINYNLIPGQVGLLYQEIGDEYKVRVIDPAVQEAVKASTAKYTAEELITKREIVREDIQILLAKRLGETHIQVTGVSIVNFKFSKSFDEAIEAKVTAEQQALAAKNKLEQSKYEAEQRIAEAKGEAEAIRIQAQAIQSQGGAEYVRLKTIEKWNGQGCTSYCGLDASSGLLIQAK